MPDFMATGWAEPAAAPADTIPAFVPTLATREDASERICPVKCSVPNTIGNTYVRIGILAARCEAAEQLDAALSHTDPIAACRALAAALRGGQ